MREYFVNADFDLSLRVGWTGSSNDAGGPAGDPPRSENREEARDVALEGHSRSTATSSTSRFIDVAECASVAFRSGERVSCRASKSQQVEELPMHLLLLGTGGDSVIVSEAPPEDFFAYLDRLGFETPRVSVSPAIRSSARFVPFGWNAEAAGRNLSYDEPSPRPPLEVVRKVNGRRFSAAVERDWCDDGSLLGEFDTLGALESCLAVRPAGEHGWIVKSEHGNSGLGNRRLRSRELSVVDRDTVKRLLAQDDCVLLERWRRRVLDMAAIFDVDGGGLAARPHCHEVVNTADGAFIGAMFDGGSKVLGPWLPAMGEAASTVARVLADAGYFGPVCLDAFVWEDGGRLRLRPVVDLNARLHVSTQALRMWRAWGGDRVVYWRFFAARKLGLPAGYQELEEALGADAFDPETRRGVLLTSPLCLGESGRRPGRFGMLMAGADREEVEGMERRLRDRFER